MSDSFAELFEQSGVEKRMLPGKMINATVVDIRDDNVVVNANLKSESIIPIDQFYDEHGELEIEPGDEIDVILEAFEDGYGETRLSREKARREETWNLLEKAHETDETVGGVIVERVKGGFIVDINKLRAFLPGSLVDVKPITNVSYLEGKLHQFKVIKIDRNRNNVVVSRRAVIESNDDGTERKALLESLEEGMLVKGIVKNLTDYGAFIDLGGIDGLLHITDMVWRRVKNPAEVVSIGDEIEVKLLKFDREQNRVSLGLKQTTEDPWLALSKRYLKNGRYHGRVTNLVDYGCFVELEEGIEGLVHVSEMDWTNKNVHPSKMVHVGLEVDVVILEIDEERRRISLGMKQCQPNPWEHFATEYNRGDHITGVIKSVTDFGIFIGLEGGIDGLVHLSDLSWTDDAENVIRCFNRGQEVETVVLGIDSERERISLGIKQLEKDPFLSFLAEHEKGSIVKGIAENVEPKMVRVALENGVKGMLKADEISSEKDIENAGNAISQGDELEVKIIAVNRKKRTVSLSIKAKELDDEKKALREYPPATGSSRKLGDILRAHLGGKKVDSDAENGPDNNPDERVE